MRTSARREDLRLTTLLATGATLALILAFGVAVSGAEAGGGPQAIAAKKCKKAKKGSAVAAKKCKRKRTQPASCVTSSVNPASPAGYADKEDPADAARYVKPPTEALVAGSWTGVFGAVGDQFTATADCKYTAVSKSPGTWSIQGNYVVFTGGLAGFCNGHALLVQRSTLQMDFYCDTPFGTNYFAYSK